LGNRIGGETKPHRNRADGHHAHSSEAHTQPVYPPALSNEPNDYCADVCRLVDTNAYKVENGKTILNSTLWKKTAFSGKRQLSMDPIGPSTWQLGRPWQNLRPKWNGLRTIRLRKRMVQP
jgi:hypothetical protein